MTFEPHTIRLHLFIFRSGKAAQVVGFVDEELLVGTHYFMNRAGMGQWLSSGWRIFILDGLTCRFIPFAELMDVYKSLFGKLKPNGQKSEEKLLAVCFRDLDRIRHRDRKGSHRKILCTMW